MNDYKLLYTFMISNNTNIGIRYEVYGDWVGNILFVFVYQPIQVTIDNQQYNIWQQLDNLDLNGVQLTENSVLGACEHNRATLP